MLFKIGLEPRMPAYAVIGDDANGTWAARDFIRVYLII